MATPLSRKALARAARTMAQSVRTGCLPPSSYRDMPSPSALLATAATTAAALPRSSSEVARGRGRLRSPAPGEGRRDEVSEQAHWPRGEPADSETIYDAHDWGSGTLQSGAAAWS